MDAELADPAEAIPIDSDSHADIEEKILNLVYPAGILRGDYKDVIHLMYLLVALGNK